MTRLIPILFLLPATVLAAGIGTATYPAVKPSSYVERPARTRIDNHHPSEGAQVEGFSVPFGAQLAPPMEPDTGRNRPPGVPGVLKVTGAALVACAVADVITTERGFGVESNPIIPTRANGKPQAWVYAARIGGTAAFVAGQMLLARRVRNKKLTAAFVAVNSVLAGRSCAVAVRNGRVK